MADEALAAMRSADELTGVHPGLSYAEIRARQVSMTTERLRAAYYVREFKRMRGRSAERGEILSRLMALVAEFPYLRSQIKQALPLFDSITRQAGGGRRGGRPRKHASEQIARREAQRAYRARQKARGQ